MTPQRFTELQKLHERLFDAHRWRPTDPGTLLEAFGELLDALDGSADEGTDRARLRFRLPYPPTGKNHLYAQTKRYANGVNAKGEPFRKMYIGRSLSPAAQKYRRDVIALVRDGGMPQLPSGALRLDLELFPPDAQRRDADGALPWVQDCLAAALEFDDSRIRCVAVRRRLPRPHAPAVVATLSIDAWSPLRAGDET